MYDLEWNREYEPKTTNEQLNEIETKLEIKIPVGLRGLWTTYSSMPPQRDGDDANFVVGKSRHSGKINTTAIFCGFLKPVISHTSIDWLTEKFDITINTVVPFASNGTWPIFLNYDNDPSRSNPEIWDLYGEGDTLDQSWSFVTPDIDTFFSTLKTQKEAMALGIDFLGT